MRQSELDRPANLTTRSERGVFSDDMQGAPCAVRYAPPGTGMLLIILQQGTAQGTTLLESLSPDLEWLKGGTKATYRRK